jgi:hypothetical protein
MYCRRSAMSATTTPTRRLRGQLTFKPTAFGRPAAWLLGFAPVVYLALSGGGYDIIVRSEIGILIWWLVLLGAAGGLLPRRQLSPLAWWALGLIAAFLLWTWLAMGWTQSQERTMAEVARVATYAGTLVLGLSLVNSETSRALLSGLACAVGLVALLAVLSRLLPSLFPADTAAKLYATPRLRYPFDYSDGVGEFAALGLPLLLFTATAGRTLAGRVVAAAGLPVVVLCLALTVSRGGILAAAVGLIVFFAVVDNRLPKLATALFAAVGSTVVMAELLHLAGVRDAFMHPAPAGQRHTMLLVLALVCIGVGIAQVALVMLGRRVRRPGWSRIPVIGARAITAAIVVVLVAVVVIGIGAGTDNHLWQQFKQPNPTASGNQYFRLFSIAGSHRYQYWQAAVAAYHVKPWQGIGPGTFEFYWAQHNTVSEFVRNAHSLYFETLAELGIVGLILIVAFILLVIIGGAASALRASPTHRAAVATGTAGFAAFAAAAAFDWVWQIGVMPLIAMLLAAVALGGAQFREWIRSGRVRFVPRVIFVVAGLVCLWGIAVPLATTVEVRASQAAALRGEFRTALSDAATAQNLESGAASPRLQRALLLEQLGDVPGARRAISQAQTRERTNWRIWLVASRLATEANRPHEALADYQHAKRLNPTSPIFAGG